VLAVVSLSLFLLLVLAALQRLFPFLSSGLSPLTGAREKRKSRELQRARTEIAKKVEARTRGREEIRERGKEKTKRTVQGVVRRNAKWMSECLFEAEKRRKRRRERERGEREREREREE
jgi:ABC-type multidrug transport system fused ATPase/permease subunit